MYLSVLFYLPVWRRDNFDSYFKIKNMSYKILITGGNGKTGRRVAERLSVLYQDFISVSRSSTPAFDWYDPSTWKGVLTGISKVYITFQPDLAVPASVDIIKAFVEASKQSGVKQLVLLSGRGEHEAQVCEQLVMNSGMDWTIVRASWFMQNFSESFLLDGVMAGEVVLPVVTHKEPFVDADDIAAVVVEALLNKECSHKLYELTGPELLSFKEAVEQISAATGKSIGFKEIPMQDYVEMLRSYQLPEDYIWLIQYLFTEVLDGRNASLAHDIEKVTGSKPRSFKTYATQAHAGGAWKNTNA